eukprot:Opistho-2@70666
MKMAMSGVIAGVVQATCSAMHWDVGEAWVPSQQGSPVFNRTYMHAERDGAVDSHGDGLTSDAMRAVCLDMCARACNEGVPIFGQDGLKPSVIETTAAVPVRVDESVIAVLVFLSIGQVEKSQATIDFLRCIGNVAERAIALSSVADAGDKHDGFKVPAAPEETASSSLSWEDDATVPMAEAMLDAVLHTNDGPQGVDFSYGALVASRPGLHRSIRRARMASAHSGKSVSRQESFSTVVRRLQLLSRRGSSVSFTSNASSTPSTFEELSLCYSTHNDSNEDENDSLDSISVSMRSVSENVGAASPTGAVNGEDMPLRTCHAINRSASVPAQLKPFGKVSDLHLNASVPCARPPGTSNVAPLLSRPSYGSFVATARGKTRAERRASLLAHLQSR